MCVLLQEGMLAAVRNKEWTAMLTDASMKGKKNNNYANLRRNNYGRIHYL